MREGGESGEKNTQHATAQNARLTFLFFVSRYRKISKNWDGLAVRLNHTKHH